MHPTAVLLSALGALALASPVLEAEEGAQGPHTLTVYLSQANNQSPYAFVRAKFEPGEVPDPWRIQFLDGDGNPIPFAVWDSVSWKVAREGRPDWGGRYALLQHWSGRSPEARAARERKIARARENLPELGAQLAAEEAAAERFPGSTCAALYLLRTAVPPFGKARLTLRLDGPAPAIHRWHAAGDRVAERLAARAGELRFEGLPDRLAVHWRGKEHLRHGGFEAGEASSAFSHADPSRPFALEVIEGLITRIHVEGRSEGRRGSEMRWQCTYWLFPEGSFVALEGFSLGDAEGYLGGTQTLSRWSGAAELSLVHAPLWDAPWWVIRSGEEDCAALSLFSSTPLTIGFSNNPFTASPSGSEKVAVSGNRLEVSWGYEIPARGVYRLFQRRLPVPPPQNEGPPWLTREAFLTGRIEPPPGMPAKERREIEEALSYTRWEPGTDWLYRQYVAGVGDTAAAAEASLRQVIGAAAGWIDRPFAEEELAGLLARSLLRAAHRSAPLSHGDVYQALPYLLEAPDPEGVRQVLRALSDPAAGAASHMQSIKNHIAAGGSGITGPWVENPHGEGWESNPAYHACGMPAELRFLEHFELLDSMRSPAPEYREALLAFADFSLQVLGGDPFDPEKLRRSFRMCWPNRMVMLFPLVLHACRIRPDERYAEAARLLFGELLSMVEQNPHGYWAAWRFAPEEAAVFDTVYVPVGYQRGITAFWAEGLVDLIGSEKASRFVAAQARYALLSGQFLDTFEADSATGVHAYFHHAHPSFSAQIALYLYDDFSFYRGLAGNLVRWAAAAGAAGPEGYFSPLFRWTFGIGPGTRWFHRAVERGPGARSFRVSVQNQLPWARCSFWVLSHEVGIEPAGRWLLWIQPREPAFRPVGVLEVEVKDDRVLLEVRRRARLRLAWSVLFPQWGSPEDVVLALHSAAGSREEIRDGEWGTDSTGERYVEWTAEPGRHELTRRR